MKLSEIAEKIHGHLKRFEADPVINKRDGCRPYYGAGAFSSGRYVGVIYISYHGVHHLAKADAAEYLAWLEDGHVGKHFVLIHAKRAKAGAA